jgi:two-component system chemotaxis response regulator CheB
VIKIFIIEDSITIRNYLKRIIENNPDFKLLGEASNPIDAIEIFKKVGFPDLFILDIEMPKMDGLTFLQLINKQNPTPTIICSSKVLEGSEELLKSLECGAVDVILKSNCNLTVDVLKTKLMLEERIYRAVSSKPFSKTKLSYTTPSDNLIVFGSSTGGVQVLEQIVYELKPHHSGILIVQHMLEGYTANLARRLSELSASKVKEACDGDIINDNCIYVAKSGLHMEVVREEYKFVIRFSDSPKVNSHKPSIDVLFKSIAKLSGFECQAFLLTGMGEDGAKGMKLLNNKGHHTYAQSETSAMVFGMPKAAVILDAVKKTVSPKEIITILNNIKKDKKK